MDKRIKSLKARLEMNKNSQKVLTHEINEMLKEVGIKPEDVEGLDIDAIKSLFFKKALERGFKDHV